MTEQSTAARDSLTYRVRPSHPEAHLFAVELLIPAAAGSEPTLSMPAWIPGSYMIRDFARNIISLSAELDGETLAVEKLDKHTWRLRPQAPAPVTVRYEVYAHELTVRSAHLDTTHAYFNGPSLFLRVAGLDHLPCRVELLPPQGSGYADWRVATSMRRDGAEPPEIGAVAARQRHPMGHAAHAVLQQV
ncbi:MAG: hypothetical protein K9M02_22170, partial [Thiohalocapsa sp.]|nr:hypothetical protein [Thiohalocapsa sp.]